MFSNSPPPPAIIQPLPPITANPAPLRHGHSLSMVAAPFIPLRPYTTFNNNSISFNSFGTLAPDGHRSPDARSDPGLPTDQSLAPPAMPARADSRPDFTRGFGLDVPDEAEEEEEEEETEPDEQAVAEVHEEAEPMLAEVSHIAVTGADDTIDMDMELEEEDAEVCNITTAAQSRVHSRHVSRLSAALSLRSVGGHVDYTEPEADQDGQAETEIDVEDDAIGEWTGSEDLRTPTEFTEDEVRKISCRVASTRASSALTIFLITSAFFLPFTSTLPRSLPPCFFTSAFRRASESGRTHLTKNALVNNANNVVLCVVITIVNSKRSPAASQISRTHR